MTLVEKAARIAAEAHKEQKRKTDESPYIAHPIICALMLAKHGFDENVVAAALVHDVLEDTDYPREDLVRELGEDVVRITDALTEDKSLGWEERKKAYAAAIAAYGTDAVLISLADKIHNLESMIEGRKKGGPEFWQYFSRGREEQIWFVHMMLETYRNNLDHPLVEYYAALVETFEEVA